MVLICIPLFDPFFQDLLHRVWQTSSQRTLSDPRLGRDRHVWNPFLRLGHVKHHLHLEAVQGQARSRLRETVNGHNFVLFKWDML